LHNIQPVIFLANLHQILATLAAEGSLPLPSREPVTFFFASHFQPAWFFMPCAGSINVPTYVHIINLRNELMRNTNMSQDYPKKLTCCEIRQYIAHTRSIM
jgi:hypothetical protein